MTLVIGLTGGIASGKSTVSAMFKQLNIPVIDADQIARDVVLPGEKTYEEIVAHFGKEILHRDGTLNRQKLGEIIFADEKKRQQLNAIIHPAIRQQMLQQRDHYVQAKEKCVVLDIPLLFESQLTDYVEKIIVVYVDEQTQLERLMTRDQSEEQDAQQRIDSQLNAIIHPDIRQQMLQQRDHYVQSKEKCVVLDIPLLFESQLTDYVEKIIVVYVDEQTQLERLMTRDQLNAQDAQKRIDSQLPLKEKVKLADAVIENNGTIPQSEAQLFEILKAWHVL